MSGPYTALLIGGPADGRRVQVMQGCDRVSVALLPRCRVISWREQDTVPRDAHGMVYHYHCVLRDDKLALMCLEGQEPQLLALLHRTYPAEIQSF